MTRPIKFRSWDEATRKMYICDTERVGNYLLLAEEGKRDVMQFTGLHDKNGKEIYEGDVVGREDKKSNEVKFIFGAFHVGQNLLYPVHPDFRDGGQSDWEVIGNIYENPELIKQS